MKQYFYWGIRNNRYDYEVRYWNNDQEAIDNQPKDMQILTISETWEPRSVLPNYRRIFTYQ